MALQILIVAAALVCAIQSLRASRLIVSALWLAGTSALVALLIYMLGAPQVAVVELSVGAGLVTILFVFAINIAGEENEIPRSLIPKPLAWVMVVLSIGLLAWFTIPRLLPSLPASDAIPFSQVIWQERGLDMLLQVALIFTGILGVVGLLVENKKIHSVYPGEEK